MKEESVYENNQRIKLLLLLEVLRNRTAKESPMTTAELCSWLRDRRVSCERRTLPRDIELLNSYGYKIETVKKGHSNAFYIDENRLTVPEIKLLVDEVKATAVLPEKETRELSDKLASLGGNAKDEILRTSVSLSSRKHSNEEILRTIMEIDKAVSLRKKVKFRYFDLNEIGKRIFRMNGEMYDANPYAMVPYEDNYYLVAYTERHNGLTMFRTDRISGIMVTDEDFDEDALRELNHSNPEILATEAFKMYMGPMRRIRLQFENSLIGAVYDHFGEDCEIMRVNAEYCEFYGQVRVSPTLWGWIFQFGNRIKVIGPKTLEEEYRKRLEEVLESYKN